MKKLLIFVGIILTLNASSQTGAQGYLTFKPAPTEKNMFKHWKFFAFPSTDSLRAYNNRWITNNAATAFTNLRLHYLLDGIIDFLDDALAGGGSGNYGIDSISAANDTTIRYRKNGVFKQFTFRGKNWTLQQVLVNGSVLTQNSVITVLDSLTLSGGKVVVDSIGIRYAPVSSDPTFQLATFGPDGKLYRSTVSPGGGGLNVYYVAQNGSSTGAGSTPETAINMARLMELDSLFRGNERIYFKANDTLRGSIIVKSGTYIGRYDTGRAPIIAGTIRSTELTWSQNGVVWSAPYNNRVGRLLRNGVPEKTAQSTYLTVTSRPNSTQITASSATGLGAWVTDAEMIAKEYNFRFKYYDITAYNSGTGNFTVNESSGIANNFQFKLFNHPELIDENGEWSWVDSVVYYRTPGNVNPNTLNVELAVYENGIEFDSLGTDFTVEGVTFYAQAIEGIKANITSSIDIENCNFYKQLENGITFNDSCENIKVYNCQFDSIGSNGILGGMAIKNFIFDKLTIRHIGTQIDPPFSRLNDIIGRNGVNGLATMIFPNSENGYIVNCVVDSVAYIGLRADASNSLITQNKISNHSLRQNDGGGIYTWGNETSYFTLYGWRRTSNVTISNNIVWNGVGGNEGGPSQPSAAMGIYLDNGTVDSKVIGNVAYDNTGSGIYVGFDTKNNEVIGNVCYGNAEGQIRILNNTMDGGIVTEGIKIRDNLLVSLLPTSNCFLILNNDAGSYDPFDNGGYCINNTLITPYTNDVVETLGSSYNLAAARTEFGVNFGQKDSYSSSFVDDATARIEIPLDLNETTAARWSVMPENYRASGYKSGNTMLGPNTAMVWVLATRNLTVNQNNGAPTISWRRDEVERLLIGVAHNSNDFIAGTATNDKFIRSDGGKLIVSLDNGLTTHFTITPTRNMGVGTSTPAYALDMVYDENTFKRISIANANAGASAGTMFQALNQNDYAAQFGILSSTASVGINGPNDVFFQANTASGANFNLIRNSTGAIRFGQYIGASVQEVARFHDNGNFMLNTTSDNGHRFQVDGSASFTGALVAGGAQYNAVTTISTTSSLPVNSYWVNVDASGGNVTITLPAASTVFASGRGVAYMFVRMDGSVNTITVQRAGGDAIGTGGTNFTLTAQDEVKGVQAISTSEWRVLNF